MMKKILYVEDNPDIASSVKIILNHSGYQVDIANNGKNGLKMIEEDSFDLIIFDIMLPDMSGIEVFEYAKKFHEEKNKICKYVFLSIINLPLNKKEYLTRMGILDYIQKPFVKEDLIQRISNLLV